MQGCTHHGGTRNLGRAIAQHLAEAGADVAHFYRIDEAAAMQVRTEIRASAGRRAEVYRVDVGDEAGLEQALQNCGSFSILVHNALVHNAMGHKTSNVRVMPDIRTDHWRDILAVNLDAAFFLTRALLLATVRCPRQQRGVHLLRTCSRGSARARSVWYGEGCPQPLRRPVRSRHRPAGRTCQRRLPGIYPKAGLRGATAEEVRAIAAQTALRRVGVPADVARVVLYYASDLSAFVMGQVLQVNGGS